jgi:hypothetical protein|tara:strand:+ start:9305 stop:10141 length:837 start_codon:yes stop_codon:yes gene_type:complete
MQTVKKRGKSNQKFIAKDALPKLTEAVLSADSLPSNLILHLKKIPELECKISSDESFDSESILKYDPLLSTPDAYDPINGICSYIETDKINKIEHNSELETGDKLCWWCCHIYDSKSLKLPIRKNSDGIYECVGNFCSPECTCAYIMDSGSRYGDKWKEYELLHQMINETHRIKPAPKRELLKVFGGTLDINEFRSNKTYNLVYPPMVSLKLQMDDTPSDKVNEEESSSFLKHSSNLKLGQLNLDNVDAHIPEKTNSNKKKNKIINGSLDRFWGNIEY